MKGSELIAEYLVQQKVPYVFGICGHGNVGMLDALYAITRQDQARIAAARAVRGPHGRCVLSRQAQPGRHADIDRTGLGEHGDVAGNRACRTRRRSWR